MANASPGADDRRQIQEFADRVHDRWGLKIDPSAYEVVVINGVESVHPKGMPLNVEETSDGKGGGSTFLSTPVTAPARPRLDRIATLASEPAWYTPTCYARLTDSPEHVGWMDSCSQWGEMDYASSTRRNLALKVYASCGANSGNISREIDECAVETKPIAGNTTFYWNDWSPKSTVQLSDCGDIGLSVGYGGVGASYTIHTCDKLVPRKGQEGGDFTSTWKGSAYWQDDVRETALLIAIGHDYDGRTVALNIRRGYKYSFCNLPPNVIDTCG
ncbi:hypothetical protein [Micromonospora sp. NPDC005313]|uniref:hypothetical protein n=1 Tax=unclassified Micromonospora TaxID=2617518 RepID=UPI0033B7C7E1